MENFLCIFLVTIILRSMHKCQDDVKEKQDNKKQHYNLPATA